MSEEFYDNLINYYKLLDKELIKFTNELLSISINPMYCSVENDTDSLVYLLERTDSFNQFDLEAIAKEHLFEDNKGWGKEFDFKRFKRK